jgi:hypothetical protein
MQHTAPSGVANPGLVWSPIHAMILVLLVLLVPLGAGTASAQAPLKHAVAARGAAGPAQMGAHAYLMRGLMNVFSLGMDDLATELRSAGVSAEVYNHADSSAVVNEIVSRYRSGDRSSVVLIGHSLGADAIVQMAQALDAQGVPVALLAPFDGTESHVVPGNVATAINFTRHARLQPSPDFHGKLENVDLSADPRIDHLNIDKSPRLHSYVLNYVRQAAATPPARPAIAKRSSRVSSRAPASPSALY